MAVYADYVFYLTQYKGTAIAETDFDRLALRASETIDQVTLERAGTVITTETDTETITKIKLALCAVAETFQSLEQNANQGEVASERVGNYSVSYAKSPTAQLSDDRKLARAARRYLWNTGLLYRGLDA